LQKATVSFGSDGKRSIGERPIFILLILCYFESYKSCTNVGRQLKPIFSVVNAGVGVLRKLGRRGRNDAALKLEDDREHGANQRNLRC
jgi:hypothetical protein